MPETIPNPEINLKEETNTAVTNESVPKTEETGSAQNEEIQHEVTIYAEPILHFKNFTITNSLINTWLVVILLIVLSAVLRKKLAEIPRGLQNVMEMVIEGAFNLADSVTGSRARTLKFFPLTFVLFIFILINNWTGLLPGIGSIGFIEVEEGRKMFIPFFRGGTADLNTTLALAIPSIVITHLFGFITLGVWNYFNKFINLKALLEIPGKILKDPAIIFVNPIKMFVGLVEIIGEIAKIASLSFRLFGNIFAGEVLIASISTLFAFFTPIPFMFLEIIIGLVQALVFSILILVFLTISTTAEEH